VQASPFCPDIAATPDGSQVWFTLEDTGKTQVFDAKPPFTVLKTLDTGPITNHVNIVRNAQGQFAYVTVGGLNEVQVFRTEDFSKVATIHVGKLPHGIWPFPCRPNSRKLRHHKRRCERQDGRAIQQSSYAGRRVAAKFAPNLKLHHSAELCRLTGCLGGVNTSDPARSMCGSAPG
jgi:hypothetical protein